MLDHQRATELARALGRIAKDSENGFWILDAEPDTSVTAGVGDEQERGGVHVAGVHEAFGEPEDGEPGSRRCRRSP